MGERMEDVLAELILVAREQERERIIKLLEERMTNLDTHIGNWSESSLHRWKELEASIASIKGEQK